MITKTFRIFSNFILINFLIIQPGHLTEKPSIFPTPVKATAKSYEGYTLQSPIQDVQVQLSVSLGEGCNARIADIIREADEFIAVFMYRLDSPVIINALADLHLNSKIDNNPVPVLVFLDHDQSLSSSKYGKYIQRLLDIVPTSLVKLGSKAFHQKVMVCKKRNQQAKVVVGSANATYEAENIHSEDTVIIESNRLAKIYLDEFYNLLTMNVKKLEVFHENRFKMDESNLSHLQALGKKIPHILSDKDHQDDNFQKTSKKASIVALGISTGFKGGKLKCFNVVDNLLTEENKFIFIFENYLTLSTDKYSEFWKNLLNATPKTIVLDDDKKDEEDEKSSNTRSILSLADKHNAFLFKPYTGGKFHHKLIIQYPSEGSPVIFTGSFHISNGAIDNNSETIIGICSEELSQEYLASIFWHSGLGNKVEAWKFREHLKFLLNKNTLIWNAAQKIYTANMLSIEGYYDRVSFVLSNLLSMQFLKVDMKKLKENEEKFQKDYKTLDNEGKYKLLSGLRECVFFNIGEIASSLVAHSKPLTSLQQSPDFPKKLPSSLKEAKQWLEEVKEWLDAANEYTKSSQTKQRVSVSLLKEAKTVLSTIDHACTILESAYNFVENFKNMLDLTKTLSTYVSQATFPELPTTMETDVTQATFGSTGSPIKTHTKPISVVSNSNTPTRILKRSGKEEVENEPALKRRETEAAYSVFNLQSFINYLVNVKGNSATHITSTLSFDLLPQALGKIANNENYGKDEIKKRLWEELKSKFEEEFMEWEKSRKPTQI